MVEKHREILLLVAWRANQRSLDCLQLSLTNRGKVMLGILGNMRALIEVVMDD